MVSVTTIVLTLGVSLQVHANNYIVYLCIDTHHAHAIYRFIVCVCSMYMCIQREGREREGEREREREREKDR
jgi:glycosylphosphatidylinositol transamidase (GPIT) subunit GPI8